MQFLNTYLAKQYSKIYNRGKYVGVAGSIGKTTAVEACRAVLSQKYRVVTTKPHLPPPVNIPNTLLKMNPSVNMCVLEMGIYNLGEMDFYLSLVKPKVAIVTKVSHDHSQFLGDINAIAMEQGKLLEQLPPDGVAILNWDDLETRKLSQRSKGGVIYFGSDPQNCTVWAGNIKVEDFRTSFELNLGVERVKVNYKLLGKHQVHAALAAAALGVVFDVPLTKIKIALESIENVENQLRVVPGPSGSIILDGTYDSSPSTLEDAIETLLEIPARRRVLVLGEMKGLGELSENIHREIARKIYREKFDMVFLGTGDAAIIADELKSLGFLEERMEENLQNSKFVSKLLKNLGKGDVCLISGSRAIRLDEVVKRISKKS